MFCKEKYQWFGKMLIKAFGDRSDFGFCYVTAGFGIELKVDVWFNDLGIYTGVILENRRRSQKITKRQAKKYISKIKAMVRRKAA